MKETIFLFTTPNGTLIAVPEWFEPVMRRKLGGQQGTPVALVADTRALDLELRVEEVPLREVVPVSSPGLSE